ETGRFVHGSVKTVVGQHSRPVSIAARSLRQNSSSCFWRRARASTLPSSMTRFRFDMIPPPTIRVSVTLSLVGSSPALAEESVRDFEVLVSPVPKPHQAMWAFSGLAHGARALPLPSELTSSERGTMRAIQRHAAAQLRNSGKSDGPLGSKNVTWTPRLRWGEGTLILDWVRRKGTTCLENAWRSRRSQPAQRARRCKAARSGGSPDQAAAAVRTVAPRVAETP